jgi:uncharacterized protein YqjF (DUF2071 family)
MASTGPDRAAPPVPLAVMTQRWETLTFLHWSYPPAQVQRLLPAGLTVDLLDGRAWVGLVPFEMRVQLPATAAAPAWLGRFPETNVRTYVTDGLGRPGIWFFSLDASRLGAVFAARAGYQLPYYWSRMQVRRSGGTVRYACARRAGWPWRPLPQSVVEVEPGALIPRGELSNREDFLTARWRLFSWSGGRLRSAQAYHQAWPLRRAEVREVRDGLVLAAGLPSPVGRPLAHHADRVDVRIGPPGRAPSP